MKLRDVVIFSGQQFAVPQCIQRIDTRATHGWQVRYKGTKFFSDGSQDGTGADRSLVAATHELLTRIANEDAPITVKSTPNVNKTSNLPRGISGPKLRYKSDKKSRIAEFSLILPQFAKPAKHRTVYIGIENRYSPQRVELALSKAIALRTKAEQEYQEEATRQRRLSALEFLRPQEAAAPQEPTPAAT